MVRPPARDGAAPPDTQLAPRNPGVEPWDTLPENQRLLAARLQEAFAAFLEHTDAQIGRLVDGLERLGQLDNTLLVLLSDNGASQEGGPFGVMHEMKYFNFMIETPDEAVERIDDIGGPHSHSNYPWGWAQAGNTPFKWYKQNTHEGGVHVPLIVHWPDGIAARGELRDQFHHVNDIAPTIYETLGVEAPSTYRGLEQLPISGVSMHYYVRGSRQAHGQAGPVLRDDGSPGHLRRRMEGRDPAPTGRAFRPGRLGALPPGRGPFRVHQPGRGDARQGGGNDRAVVGGGRGARGAAPRRPDHRTVLHPLPGPVAPSLQPDYSYFPPMSPLPGQVAPSLGGRGWDMAAVIERTQGADGVLYATGTENSGVSLFVQNGRLVFDYNCFGEHHLIESEGAVPVGPSVVGVRFRRTGKGGQATLLIDGQASGAMAVPFAMTMISSVGPSIGYDHGSPVSERYRGHFPFEGRLVRLDVTLVRQASVDADAQAEADQRAAMSRQ